MGKKGASACSEWQPCAIDQLVRSAAAGRRRAAVAAGRYAQALPLEIKLYTAYSDQIIRWMHSFGTLKASSTGPRHLQQPPSVGRPRRRPGAPAAPAPAALPRPAAAPPPCHAGSPPAEEVAMGCRAVQAWGWGRAQGVRREPGRGWPLRVYCWHAPTQMGTRHQPTAPTHSCHPTLRHLVNAGEHAMEVLAVLHGVRALAVGARRRQRRPRRTQRHHGHARRHPRLQRLPRLQLHRHGYGARRGRQLRRRG